MSRVTTCNKCGKKLDMLDTQESFRFYSKGRLGYGTKCCSISPIVDDRYFSEGGD